MLKQWIAVLTAFTILHCSNVAMAQTAPGKGAGRERGTPAEQVQKIKPDKKIEVRLTTGQTLKGKLVRVTPQGFELRLVEAGRESVQSVAFQDVESVKKRGWSMWAKIGVGYAICMTIFLILFHDFSV